MLKMRNNVADLRLIKSYGIDAGDTVLTGKPLDEYIDSILNTIREIMWDMVEHISVGE